MEGFTYSNIFDTKGIEYLIIIAFFAFLIPFWLFMNRKMKPTNQTSKNAHLNTPGSIQIPQGVFFSKFHTWAHLEPHGNAKIGIDGLLLHITGNVEVENIKKPGDFIVKGDVMTAVSSNKKKLRVKSPISGEIVELNPLMAYIQEPISIESNRNLWIYSIKPTNWKAETNNCFLAEEATVWMLKELARIKEFLSIAVSKIDPHSSALALQDGGELIDQPLANLPVEIWQDFQDTFLN